MFSPTNYWLIKGLGTSNAIDITFSSEMYIDIVHDGSSP